MTWRVAISCDDPPLNNSNNMRRSWGFILLSRNEYVRFLVSQHPKSGKELQCHMALDQNPLESLVVHPKKVVFWQMFIPKNMASMYFLASDPSLCTQPPAKSTGQASNLGVVALTKFDAQAKQEEKVEPVRGIQAETNASTFKGGNTSSLSHLQLLNIWRVLEPWDL